MMPLVLANVGEPQIVKRIGGNPETKRHLEDLGFTVGGEVFVLNAGETLIMPKDIPHAVYGEERFKMQLTVSF